MQIIADSCCDKTEELAEKIGLLIAPLILTINGREIVDDGTTDTQILLAEMDADTGVPRSACPSPEAFMQLMQDEENFVVTLSSHLSGSYQSAMLGASLAKEQDENKQVHVFDSKSAAAGETLIALTIRQFIDEGVSFADIIIKVEAFIKGMNTFFVLQCLDNLIKNGRMSKTAGLVAKALQIRPIMQGDDGKITLSEKVRGTAQALQRLAQKVSDINDKLKREILIISHCNCYERALGLMYDVQARCKYFKKIYIVPTSGVSSLYANNGGVIVAF